jgi:hypothetical protein
VTRTQLAYIRTPPITNQDGSVTGNYLWLDGSGVTNHSASGAGHAGTAVSTEAGIKNTPVDENLGLLNIHYQDDGTVLIESAHFANVFLRLDGTGLTSFHAHGGGTVNLQLNAGPWEIFKIVDLGDGSGFFNIESVAFPNRFLRCDNPGPVGGTITTGAVREPPSVKADDGFDLSLVADAVLGSGGDLNAQWTAGNWERFDLVPA